MMGKALWSISSHKGTNLFWQWADRVNFVDKLIIKNHMHHEAHEIGMKYFFDHPEYDYYIISTDDVLATPYHIRLLLEDADKYKFPVVSGWCSIDPELNGLASLTVKPIDPAILKTKRMRMSHYKFLAVKDILMGKYGYPFIKAWFNANAFNLVKRETLKKVPYHPFTLQHDRLCIPPTTRKQGRGVMFDLQFAIDCAQAQIPIMVDTRIFILHARSTASSQVGREKRKIEFIKAVK